MADKDNRYTVHSIAKVFTIIEAMALQPHWELVDLCRYTGLPKTTVHRFLATLEELGYVSQQKDRGNYSLTLKLTNLGNRIASNSDIVEIARPYCKDLRDKLDETVNLCTLSGTKMLVLDRQQSRQLLRQESMVGSSFTCFYSASGKAFMAFMDEEELGRLLERIRLESNGKISQEEILALKKDLKNVRQSRLGYDNEEVYPGVRCIASPIFNQNSDVVATVGILAPTIRLNDSTIDSMSSLVRETAIKISHQLGASY